jgi:hypothetical protein
MSPGGRALQGNSVHDSDQPASGPLVGGEGFAGFGFAATDGQGCVAEVASTAGAAPER